ncbi:ECU06_0605 [Encephalitozoon cuniculi GB-M1]|uniref:ECU06_0605 protein n=1 Tax=Encephalitozoon cuniculi (strain GB-M1) TaxID=284813 RepID=I7JTZ9_ENCCU|nr:uncharacterized protein ECU06_0605 [Encephalitozoon cuniculi GB-M1]UYI27652.1 hypothetical protein J0A71_07g15300 [Encephalitozoon cuniculi]CCI73944.1 ECU06_0605 [Encephalitozoon cuniculi GB-M1]
MDASRLSCYSEFVSVLSFVLVAILTLVSIFCTHYEMSRAFKATAVMLLLLSGYLARRITTTLYSRGYACMLYTLLLHGALLFVLVLGARISSRKQSRTS